MGFGKTYIALCILSKLFEELKIAKALIVAPLNVAQITWPTEIESFEESKWMTYKLVLGDAKQRYKALMSPAMIYIVNYENLQWLAEIFKHESKYLDPDSFPIAIVWDEISKMKSPKSKRFKDCKSLIKLFDYKIGLTGTSMPNGLLDLWSQIYCLDGGERLGTSFYEHYRKRYFYPSGYNGYNWKPHDYSEKLILDRIKRIMFREVHDFEIPLEIIDVYGEFASMEQRKYRKFEREMFIEFEDSVTVSAPTTAAVMNKLLQYTGGWMYFEETGTEYVFVNDLKLKMLRKLDSELKDNALIAYSYRNQLDELKAFGEIFGLQQNWKETQISCWNQKRIPRLIVHPASCGHGLNLQFGGHILIWYGLPWSLELYQQTIKRLHRPGQEHPVKVYRLLIRNTIDEYVAATLELKDRTQENLSRALMHYKERVTGYRYG